MATQGAWIRSWNFIVYILFIVPMVVYRWWPKILMISTPIVICFKYVTLVYFQHYMLNETVRNNSLTYSVIFNLFFILMIYILYIFFGATDWLVTTLVGVPQTVAALYLMVRFVCVPVISQASTSSDYMTPFVTTIVLTILALATSHYAVYRNEIELFLYNEESQR